MSGSRISLLSCCHIPASFSSNQQHTQTVETRDCHFEAALWEPLEWIANRKPNSNNSITTDRYLLTKDNNTTTAALDDIWLCPEISQRVWKEWERRQQALDIAQRMAGSLARSKEVVSATKVEEEPKKGIKRKALRIVDSDSDDKEENKPLRVDRRQEVSKQRPHSLLIPSMLPKGMLRSTVVESTKTVKPPEQSIQPLEKTTTAVEHQDFHPGLEGLGLDLGFNVAAMSSPLRSSNPTSMFAEPSSSAISEITSFLEKDVDMFTSQYTQSKRSNTHHHQGLVDDILKMTFDKD